MAREPDDTAVPDDVPETGVLREATGLLLSLCGLAATGYFLLNHDAPGPTDPKRFQEISVDAYQEDVCGPRAADGLPIVLSMSYSRDKEPWIEHVATVFARRCKNIQLKLTPVDSIASVEALLTTSDRETIPTLWSPTDALAVEYLDARWKQRSTETLMHAGERTSLLRSPLVVMVWEDRADLLEAVLRSEESPEGSWMNIACPLVPREAGVREISSLRGARATWVDWAAPVLPPVEKRGVPAPKKRPIAASDKPLPSRETIATFGQVNIIHPIPSQADTGLDALYLMAYDFVLPPGERHAVDGSPVAASSFRVAKDGPSAESGHLRGDFKRRLEERKQPLEQWLRRCEAGILEMTSSGSMATDLMFNVGAPTYDGVMTYEHLTLPILEQIGEHERAVKLVRVLYPATTIVSDHPVVFLLPDDPKRAGLRVAAEKWIAFLRSTAMQNDAIGYGFRPADARVSIEAHEVGKNPFLKLRRYGIQVAPALTEPPLLEGEAIDQIVDLWETATGRN